MLADHQGTSSLEGIIAQTPHKIKSQRKFQLSLDPSNLHFQSMKRKDASIWNCSKQQQNFRQNISQMLVYALKSSRRNMRELHFENTEFTWSPEDNRRKIYHLSQYLTL